MKKLSKAIHQMQREDFFGQENSKKVIFTMIEAAKNAENSQATFFFMDPKVAERNS